MGFLFLGNDEALAFKAFDELINWRGEKFMYTDFGKDGYSDIEVVTVWTLMSREEGKNGNSFEQVTELGQALKIVGNWTYQA